MFIDPNQMTILQVLASKATKIADVFHRNFKNLRLTLRVTTVVCINDLCQGV